MFGAFQRNRRSPWWDGVVKCYENQQNLEYNLPLQKTKTVHVSFVLPLCAELDELSINKKTQPLTFLLTLYLAEEVWRQSGARSYPTAKDLSDNSVSSGWHCQRSVLPPYTTLPTSEHLPVLKELFSTEHLPGRENHRSQLMEGNEA